MYNAVVEKVEFLLSSSLNHYLTFGSVPKPVGLSTASPETIQPKRLQLSVPSNNHKNKPIKNDMFSRTLSRGV